MTIQINEVCLCYLITDDDKKELSSYAKNYLPILFNLYTVEDKDGGPDKLPILETVRAYLTVTDMKVRLQIVIIILHGAFLISYIMGIV